MTTPAKTYKEQRKTLIDALEDLEIKVEREIEAYDRQIKDKPESWAGIGRGADLEDLIAQIKLITNNG